MKTIYSVNGTPYDDYLEALEAAKELIDEEEFADAVIIEIGSVNILKWCMENEKFIEEYCNKLNDIETELAEEWIEEEDEKE